MQVGMETEPPEIHHTAVCEDAQQQLAHLTFNNHCMGSVELHKFHFWQP